MNKNQEYINEFANGLHALDIASLRNKASKNFGIKLTREHTKEDIINLIIAAVSKSNYAEISDGELKPGYAKIKLLPVAGKVTFPVYLNCNGYFVFIPVNEPVHVPIKVIEILEHAEEMRKTQDELGEYKDTFELSYPFQVLATNPGPDPKPGREVAADKKWAPFRKFYKKFGYWPSQKVLQAATASSLQFNSFESQEETE